MSALVADGPAQREDFDHYARSQPLPRIPSSAALPPLPVLLRTSIAQAGVPEDGLAVEPYAPPSYQPVPSPPPPPDRWQREQEEFMRAQWEELHRRTIRKRKERADERDGLHDDDPYGGRHRSSSSRQQPAAHPLDQQLGPTARQPTMTSTYATGYSPLSGGPWPWPTDSRFGGGSGDDWWPAFRGGGGSRGIPRNPAPLALEHVMPFLADYDFTTIPLVVTTLHQAFIAMQIPEPKDFQGLGLPRVLYTSPGYASLSLFPTEEEVGKLAFSILPDLENMSLLVAHLLIGIPEKPFTVGPVFRCLCYILQKGGNAIQVSCCVQNLYSRRGLVKWQIMVVDGVVGRAATLPPYMGTMQKDDLMRDYLHSRISHYIHLLDASTSRSSVRATIEQQEPQHHHRPDVYPTHLLWE